MTTTADGSPWRSFGYDDLLRQQQEAGDDYLRFLNEPSMSMGLYRLAAGADDEQEPHRLDEIYYVVSGTATLVVEDERHAVRAGSIAFVRAEAEHRFVDISEDLDALVVFVNAKPDPDDADALVFHLEALRTAAQPDENVWNEFVKVATMRFGLYLLPEAIGGDNALTHGIDEVNLVVGGTARFNVGDDALPVQPGSIVFVRRGIPHWFDELAADLEVLILFPEAP